MKIKKEGRPRKKLKLMNNNNKETRRMLSLKKK
jgi:hypothetical protein